MQTVAAKRFIIALKHPGWGQIFWPHPCFSGRCSSGPDWSRLVYAFTAESMSNKDVPSKDGGAAADDAPKTGMKAKLPMIAMMAVGLAVGGGTGAAVIGPIVAKKMGRAASAQTAPAAAEEEVQGEGGGHGAEGEAGASSGAPTVFMLDNLVLNPAGTGGNRFLLLTVAMETTSSKVNADLQARDPEVRDIVLTALANKTVDQLTAIENREGIKTELIAALTARFGKGTIKRLYFPQFVVQ